MQSLQKEIVVLHAACATERAAHAKSLLEVSTLWIKEAAQMKSFEKLNRSLVEKLSAWERIFADKRHARVDMTVMKKFS